MNFNHSDESITPDITHMLTINGDALELPAGPSLTGPTAASPGAIRYNTTTNYLELRGPANWENVPRYAIDTATTLESNTVTVGSVPSVLTGTTLSPVAGLQSVNFNSQFATIASSITQVAATDLTELYDTLQSTPPTATHPLVFGTETVSPGVYSIAGAGSITTVTTVTLDASGDPNALFIFLIDGAFSTGASAAVVLTNGAHASNVFWVAQGAISLGASTSIQGTLLSLVAASCGDGCDILGRLVSIGGAISVTTSAVTAPTATSATQISLGTVDSFALFTKSGGVTGTGICTVTGDIGTNLGAITGFDTSVINGSVYTPATMIFSASFGIYHNGVLITTTSRLLTYSISTEGCLVILSAVIQTTTDDQLDVRVKVNSGTAIVANRIIVATQVG